jgi:hypothetical protein
VDQVRGAFAPRESTRDESPWQGTEDRVVDTDPLRLPQADELVRWLDVACGALPRRDEEADPSARVEAAAVIETWVATGGRRAARSRLLAWAAAEPKDAADWARGPLVLAGRTWESLGADGWASIAADRVWPGQAGRARTLPAKVPLLLSPEASATLVATLVGALHVTGGAREIPVGPGWRVRDDPFAAGAVRARAFDDACFDTRVRCLADGHAVVGGLGGAGTLHRGSYRDWPQPRATHLVVEPPPTELPREAILATGLRVHPLAPDEWLLELRGGVLRGGEPGPAIERAILPTSPADLAARCVAGLGPAQASWRHTTAPALLFDNLTPALLP